MSIAQQIMANPGRYSKEQLQSALNQGLVPAYVAIPLIEQKAKEAAAFQTAELASQAPQQNAPTVAEEVLARANQPMGVPSLPTNLPEGYAPGGIVAFDDGGEVGMAEGGVVGFANGGTPERIQQLQEIIASPATSNVEKERARGELISLTTSPNISARGGARTPYGLGAAIPEFVQRKQREYENLPKPYGASTNYQDPRVSGFEGVDRSVTDLVGALMPPPADRTLPPSPSTGGIAALPAAPGMPKISTTLGRATNLITPEIEEQLRKSREPIYLDESKYVPAERSIGDVTKGIKDLQSAFGVSEKPYEDQVAKLGKREKDLEARRAQSTWEALIEGGLAAAAGTSRFALQNISQGGLKGLQRYTESREKLDASQERLDAAQFALADAQNRFRQEGSKEAGAELRENRRDVAQARRDVAKDKVVAERQAQVFGRDDVKTILAEKGRVQTTNLDQQAKEADLAIKRAGLSIQSFSAQTQRIATERPDLVTATLGFLNQDPEFQNASGKKKAEMFSDAISDSRKTSTGSQGYTLQAKLQQEFSPGGGQYPEYKRIEKKEGRDAAEKFRRDWIAGEMGKQPAVTGGRWGELQVSGG